MAKNANAKAWALQVGELARRWSDQPFDLTGPSAPTIVTHSAPTQTSIGVRVSAAAIDARTGISGYLIEISQDAGGPFSVFATISVTEATTGYTISGLAHSTIYHTRLKGIDGSIARNIGAASNTVVQATAAPSVPTTWWPNWPMASTSFLQGNISTTLLDTSTHSVLADLDLVGFQGFYPTTSRKISRCSNIDLVRNIRAGRQGSPADATGWPKMGFYQGVQQTIKDQTLSQQSNLEIARDIINSGTLGPSSGDWYLHRVAPNQAQVLEPNFGQASNRQINMAIEDMSLNSFGRTYIEEFWRQWELLVNDVTPGENLKSRLNWWFQDNFDARIPNVWINNGATQVTDHDTDQDGDIDVRNDFSAGDQAGGRKWAAGSLSSIAAMQAQFPGYILVPNSARWDVDYFDGQGAPSLPLSTHPFYRRWEFPILRETINNSYGLTKSGTTYNYTGTNLSTACRALTIQERFLAPDADCDIVGKNFVLVHTSAINRAPTQDDYRYLRFAAALCMLGDRWAPCLQADPSRPLVLDETLLEYGNPVGVRSMGTLNENTLSFSMRTANFSSGVARFYWQFYEKAFVLLRGDNPTVGTWPNGADAAISCTLPAPPSGKKFQRIHAGTYVNPNTGAAMRNQSSAINSGVDAGTTISLAPYDAIILRIVDL